MWETLGTVRDLGRLQEIAGVLVRYGFGDMVRRIGMAGALERTGRLLRWDDPEAFAHMASPERVRCALQDLGPTFVKLGQVMATRVGPAAAGVDRRTGQAAERGAGAAVRRSAPAAGRGPGRRTGARVRTAGGNPAGRPHRWPRPIAPGWPTAARWC